MKALGRYGLKEGEGGVILFSMFISFILEGSHVYKLNVQDYVN